MKILIDECLPKNLKHEFVGHSAMTVQEMGWDSLWNGELMTAAVKDGFEVFVTIDKNLKHQQNLKKYDLIVVVLDAVRNEIEYLKPLMPEVLRRLNDLQKGEAHVFSIKNNGL